MTPWMWLRSFAVAGGLLALDAGVANTIIALVCFAVANAATDAIQQERV